MNKVVCFSRIRKNNWRHQEQRGTRENGIEETPLQSVHRQIDEIVENFVGNEVTVRKKRPIKAWTKRPENWIDIVEDANACGSRQAIRSFEGEFEGLTRKSSMKKINRWQKDNTTKKTISM